MTTLAHVRPIEVELMTEGLVHSHDTLEQRMSLRAIEGVGELERALGREIVGRGRQRRFERQGDVGHLEMGSEICRRGVDDWAIVILFRLQVVRSGGAVVHERVLVVVRGGHGGGGDVLDDEQDWREDEGEEERCLAESEHAEAGKRTAIFISSSGS